jgi:hypothetical protein
MDHISTRPVETLSRSIAQEHGTTEHTEHTEARDNGRRIRFRVFGVFCGSKRKSMNAIATFGTSIFRLVFALDQLAPWDGTIGQYFILSPSIADRFETENFPSRIRRKPCLILSGGA